MSLTTVSGAANFVSERIKSFITQNIKILLEQKHMYQNLSLDIESHERDEIAKLPQGFIRNTAEKTLEEKIKLFWCPLALDGTKKSLLMMAIEEARLIYFSLPRTAKLFCSSCDREEPFNPVYGEEIVSYVERNGVINQVFVLIFQCQSCKGVPEVFMINRRNWKLTLTGRCPMEIVQVPKYIPKSDAKYYSDAVIAFNSGQTLAGLFLLRTFIEQYAIRITGNTNLLADKIIDLYMEGLPKDFKKRFPSLRKIYGDLSDAIHKANASDELFKQSLIDINNHFDAKRLYKL